MTPEIRAARDRLAVDADEAESVGSSLATTRINDLRTVLAALDRALPTRYDHLLRGGENQPVVDESRCAKCLTPFAGTAQRGDPHRRYLGTAYCRNCVDLCHDSEIADHRCVICAPAGTGAST